MRATVSWEARLLIGAIALTVAAFGVFRATLPHTLPLFVRDEGAPLDATTARFAELLQAHTGARLTDGNRVEVLLNGSTYSRLWADLRGARRSITVQSYYAQPGAVADTLAAILAAQAQRGVEVRLLLDAFGAAPMPTRWMSELRRAGVRVALLRPIHWHSMHGAGDRSHVRIVVVDGRVAYTGGFGFADYWSGDGRTAGHWRETNARLEGPAATQFQATFAAGWVEATGELLVDDAHFTGDAAGGGSGAGVDAALLYTTTTTGTTTAERFLALTIAAARQRLQITNSYFVPNADLRALLIDAASRGVDVRILTAGRATDVATTWYAGRRHYAELLRGGVRLYEYDVATLHAKSMTIDGIWSTLGSMNLDNRSLAFNDESTLLVRDRGIASEMDRAFEDDLRHAREVTLEAFGRRPVVERVLERAASLLSALL